MFIGAAIFLVLIVMGGVIAFLGDRIGSKVGKKRMSLFLIIAHDLILSALYCLII